LEKRFTIFLLICTADRGRFIRLPHQKVVPISIGKLFKLSKLSFLKPAVPKRALLFVAAAVWTFAGSMLLYKGFKMMGATGQALALELILSLIAGIIFYWTMFAKISFKHTHRILNLKEAYPCLFSFFNIRSYFLMALMISMGITLRMTGWVTPAHLSYLYFTMSVPLLLSSIRFYYTGFYYGRIIESVNPDRFEQLN
jgi:hypothetical protein